MESSPAGIVQEEKMGTKGASRTETRLRRKASSSLLEGHFLAAAHELGLLQTS